MTRARRTLSRIDPAAVPDRRRAPAIRDVAAYRMFPAAPAEDRRRASSAAIPCPGSGQLRAAATTSAM